MEKQLNQEVETGYNGYSNYETWNVALHIQNDEGLYRLARRCRSYKEFILRMREIGGEIGEFTPDGIRWDDLSVDHGELEEVLEGL